MFARTLLVAAGIATVAACGAQSSGGASVGGLYGTVSISPSSPVCVVGKPCTKPARHFRIMFTAANGRKVTATTDARGHYRVRLAGGRYTVRAVTALSTSPKRGLQPRTVTVPNGSFAKRNFVYDTGIR